ncbi:DUF5683 domain-containing protein [Methanolobus mangrovi]|uniref:DUF5683 domain-containing protein n=1 Tax=Methanolobus mangrovi TaxID=3072977 RepID=A0AA51YGB3_9EURY|nr:DUF5683 domain-containing protein [Methanolobus mangrovi]WMW21841.1 DUF5683 domain-containing protein [Methanolobus mangrovi]
MPWKSALYSLVFPGLGQMYNGDFRKGSYYFVIAFILIVTAYLLFPILIIFWLYNVYQAFNYARNYQNGTKNSTG